MTSLDVSRETEEMLREYVDLLLQWTNRINLISTSTIPDVWNRHILDCVQAVRYSPSGVSSWADIGSGGGLPGIISAIFFRETLSSCTLIESDSRKCAFLRTVKRKLSLNVSIQNRRIEECSFDDIDVISARALAPLIKLLDLTGDYATGSSQLLFMKGRQWKKEVAEARAVYSFSLEVQPSMIDTESATLLISNVSRNIK